MEGFPSTAVPTVRGARSCWKLSWVPAPVSRFGAAHLSFAFYLSSSVYVVVL